MLCPYCSQTMKRYAEDSAYDYFRCINQACPQHGSEHMNLKPDDERLAATATAELDMEQRRARRGW